VPRLLLRRRLKLFNFTHLWFLIERVQQRVFMSCMRDIWRLKGLNIFEIWVGAIRRGQVKEGGELIEEMRTLIVS